MSFQEEFTSFDPVPDLTYGTAYLFEGNMSFPPRLSQLVFYTIVTPPPVYFASV